MFYEFSHRHTDCFVDGLPDKVILTREARSSSVFNREFLYSGTFSPTSNVQPGSMVDIGDSFLVQSKRITAEGDRSCSLVKTNAVVTIQRWSQALDANDNPIGGPTFNDVQSNVDVFAQYVSGRLRQEDIGLLPTTVYVVLLQTSSDLKRPQEVTSPDRIVLNGRSYQVDAVDDVKVPNLFYVQLSEDLR
ncbi:hypothetical protein [Paenibacillus thermotolerans]|uniref:hypothetical protein n=1 Tax=Paenibacillus thermotolerans TaxID=3027807 RepID=UPI002368394A|nr:MULTISPECIES: hypothetical protein [unclassified Paenibacillus]